MLADRIGGRKVTIFMLATTAVPAFFVSKASSYGMLLVLAFLVGFAGNLFSVGIAWNAAWFGREQQGFALGVFGAGNVGASVTKFIGPRSSSGPPAASFVLGVRGGWRLVPVISSVLLWPWPSSRMSSCPVGTGCLGRPSRSARCCCR